MQVLADDSNFRARAMEVMAAPAAAVLAMPRRRASRRPGVQVGPARAAFKFGDAYKCGSHVAA